MVAVEAHVAHMPCEHSKCATAVHLLYVLCCHALVLAMLPSSINVTSNGMGTPAQQLLDASCVLLRVVTWQVQGEIGRLHQVRPTYLSLAQAMKPWLDCRDGLCWLSDRQTFINELQSCNTATAA